jgi:hypothetical protein
MRVIQNKVSLEAFTSRLPGVVPAYREGKLYYFDDTALKKRENAFPSNYGMIPKSVIVPDEYWKCESCGYTASTEFSKCPECKSENVSEKFKVPALDNGLEIERCNKSKRVLSWERISDWYHFFTDYYHLLKDWSHCGRVYASATEYYDYESKNGYADQLIYGSLRQTYADLDNLFAERGGEDLYNYISDYLIPSVEIPAKYKDYWHADRLYYPDIVRWKNWFAPRVEKYGSITLENIGNCSATTDCCDCTEYVNRGDSEMATLLNNAYNGMQSKITAIKTCDPYFMTDVSMQVSLDNLGEFSILSDEYKLGMDYRVSEYGSSTNTKGGTVVAIEGMAMKLVSGCGFSFNEQFMEKTFDASGWTENTGGYEISGVTEESEDVRYYQSGRTDMYYAFRPNMEKVTGSGESEVRGALKEYYKVTPVNAMYVDGTLYDIQEEEYGLYKGDASKKLYVYREEYTQTPYTILNGNKIYGEARPQSVCQYFYFPFFPKEECTTNCKDITYRDSCNNLTFHTSAYKWFPRERDTKQDNVSCAETEEFIRYNDGFFKIDSLTDTTRVAGVAYTPYGSMYIGTGSTPDVYRINEEDGLLIKAEGFSYKDGYIIKKENTEVIVYNSSVISGTAASKLYELRSLNLLTDDTGDVLQGRYDVSGKTNHQPPEGTELDLIYEVGNTNRVVPFPEAGENLYFGDMITSMSFYYKDYEGNKYGIVTNSIYSADTCGTSLEAISASTSAITDMIENGEVEPDIYCEVQYVIGATLSGVTIKDETTGGTLVVGIKYSLADASSGYSNGVLYTEEVQFVRTEVQYKLATAISGQIPMTENEPTAHKLCYPVVCYILKQKKYEIDSDFGSQYYYALADFVMKFPSYYGWVGYVNSTEIFPVLRQEYMLGNSMMQKLDVDIYIDRGINAAYEKHLKLGEVTTMEALEQYTNGYFKMMEN